MKKIDIKKVYNVLAPLLILFIFDFVFLSINKSFILSIFIIYSIYFILISIFKNSKWPILILSIVSFAFLVTCLFRIEFSGEPFYLSDLLYSSDMGEIMSLVSKTMIDTIIKLSPKLLFTLISLVLITIFGFKYTISLNTKNRIIYSSVGILIFLAMFLPIKATNQFVIKYFYTDKEVIDSNIVYCKKYGYLSCMYGNLLEGRVYKPDNYNPKEIDKIVNSAEEEKDNSLGKPNIIVIFSESFWDADQLDEVKFNKQLTKNFNKLKEEGLFFNMISPSFAGTSANVEFEFLTGGTITYFGSSYVPYMNLYHNSKYNNVPSIVNELSDAGYYTKLVPFTSSSLFKCGNVYKHMKVDEAEFYPEVEKEHIKGQYVSDEYVTDKVIETMNKKEKDKPLFYMTMTMESHMPYKADKYENYDIEITESNLNKELNNQLRAYAQGVYDADEQLGRLYDYIKEYDEPTLIIFYGDHLPIVFNDKSFKYFNTDNQKTNLYRKYNTQSLILSNFDITNLKEENKNELKYLSPDLLSAYVLNHMDIDVSNYYKWLYSTRNTIAAYNRYISINQNGDIYFTNSLSGDMKELYDLRKKVQYRYFIK